MSSITASSVRRGSESMIVQVLSSGFPLTAERIYCIVKNRSRGPFTYGQLYREIELLSKRGLIIKSEDGYVINPKCVGM